jgi:hypothetical protein
MPIFSFTGLLTLQSGHCRLFGLFSNWADKQDSQKV